jgi:cation transporter-like permease
MPIRVRKLIGTVALLVLVIVWALVAMGFAQMLSLSNNRLVEIAYYVVAGLGWVLPAMPLISWMSRPDPEPDEADPPSPRP